MNLPRLTKNTLSQNELLLLRSYAVGMGSDSIIDLLDITEQEYCQIEKKLFHKLQANNVYCAVMTAFRMNILSAKEYSPEAVKAVALAYAHKVVMQTNTQTKAPKHNIWELYELLLDFEAYRIVASFRKNIKKNPTEAG